MPPTTPTYPRLTTIFGPNPNISFFPAKRVRSISDRLGHNRLDQLLEEIRAVVASKVKATSSIPQAHVNVHQGAEPDHDLPGLETINSHIGAYFDTVHPLYPFLSPDAFRQRAAVPDLAQSLAADKSWAALFYAVLAIGCQNNEGGSFEAGIGEAWSYFERSLSYFQALLFGRGSLTAVQAFMALAIFSSTVSAFQFEPLMLSEAATMAQGLGFNRSNSPQEGPCRRTFWVLYFMEKTSCFTTGKVSILEDANISCAIPDVPESTFDDYDWFFSFVKYARLVAKIHQSLFTISSVSQPLTAYNSLVESLRLELESWRLSAPPRFRPGEMLKPRLLRESLTVQVALTTHFLYLNALLTLSWTVLHYGAVRLGTTQQEVMKRDLMRTARSVLELTGYIEVAPSTPVWILAVLPLSSLMILFDLVVHNPNHPETGLSLALLDIAGGHFSRLEYASKGALPGSLVAEFAHLARNYVSETRKSKSREASENVPLQLAAEAPPPPPPAGMLGTAMNLNVPMMPQPQESVAGLPDVTQPWSPASLDRNESLFLPFVDDPSYYLGDLQLFGIDVRDLFDHPYSL
ncbi:fungal-specific transcription factor [Aspergillus heteromorphus CBS 117.55]|uniref:Fungal-specific transcription factor n=1 Tax=Aspergillus heteromorphus CBS 117.55 TaxID=1448321 RepID=A0A317WJZ4_9EURO|nr:fungal-specific transcription factor [Aspergillus heteromorphus CBS 117.55]PWY86649.1 fungal-specific transcription factor [Aspergillus heteromorphus CBS 117.55]